MSSMTIATTLTFDTLGYFERLTHAGVPEAQAKVHTEALREIIEDKLATKRDILALQKDLLELEARLDAKMETKIRELEYRLTIRLGGMMAASVAVVAALVKLL